jgi:hypothetical protein
LAGRYATMAGAGEVRIGTAQMFTQAALSTFGPQHLYQRRFTLILINVLAGVFTAVGEIIEQLESLTQILRENS